MATGFPDYYLPSVILGWDGSTHVAAKCLTTGELYAILRGASGVNLTVDANGNIVAVIKGEDPNTTLRTLSCNTSGELIAILKSAAGNNVVVDASGFLTTILKATQSGVGLKDVACNASGELIAILKSAAGNNVTVDSNGFLTAILKGVDSGATLRTLMVDTAGYLAARLKIMNGATMKDMQSDANGYAYLNVKAQDLAEVINRPKYGAAASGDWAVLADASATKTLVTISGKGIIYGGIAVSYGQSSIPSDSYYMVVDGSTFLYWIFSNYLAHGLLAGSNNNLFLTNYNTTDNYYALGIQGGITFETSVVIRYSESGGNQPNLAGCVLYALV